MTFLALAGLVLGAMIVGGLIGASVMCVIHYEEGKREMEADKELPPDSRYLYPNAPPLYGNAHNGPAAPPMPPAPERIDKAKQPSGNNVDEWV